MNLTIIVKYDNFPILPPIYLLFAQFRSSVKMNNSRALKAFFCPLIAGLAQEVTSLRIKNSEEDAVAGVSPSLEKLLNELRRPRSSKNDRSQDPLEEFFFHERKSGLKLLKNVEKRIESLIDTLSGISKTVSRIK